MAQEPLKVCDKCGWNIVFNHDRCRPDLGKGADELMASIAVPSTKIGYGEHRVTFEISNGCSITVGINREIMSAPDAISVDRVWMIGVDDPRVLKRIIESLYVILNPPCRARWTEGMLRAPGDPGRPTSNCLLPAKHKGDHKFPTEQPGKFHNGDAPATRDEVPCGCCGIATPRTKGPNQEWGTCTYCINAGCTGVPGSDGDQLRGKDCPAVRSAKR